MKLKTMVYAALGWATWKAGRLYLERRARRSTSP
jgi:hypothetical protein